MGSAVEHAAASLVVAQADRSEDERYAKAVDFVTLFADVEGEDEEGGNLADVLEILRSTWEQKYFQAADVARMMNAPMEGERAKSDRLRSFFDNAGRKNTGDVSVISVGRRLGMLVDVPMVVGETVLKLVKSQPENQAAQRKVTSFTVRVS